MRTFFLLLFATLPLFPIYIGNPASPSIMNMGLFSAHNPLIKGSTGYIRDLITNKLYEADASNPNYDPNDTFKKFIIHSQMASFSLVFLERLELYGTVGGSRPRITHHEPPFDANLLFDFKGSYQFAWSTGAKIVLIQWGQTYLGTDFVYYALPESSHSYFRFLDNLNLPIEFGKQELSLEEWQLSLGLASKLAFLTPYFGGTYLKSKLHIAGNSEVGSFDYKNKHTFGYFYGITISMTGRFHFNFEQRFRDEKGYTFSTIAVF